MITTENRQRIRRMHQEGSTITEISTALGVSRTTVYSYLRDQKRGLRVSRRGPVSKLAEANQDKLKEAIQALRGNASALGYLLRSECIIQKFSYGKSRPYVHSSGISIRVQSLNLIQLSTFSRTRILKSHTLNKRNTDKDGIWNLSGLNIQNVRTAIHLFRTLVQNLHTFIHFSRTQIQNFHSSILKFHSPILKPRFRIQKSRLPVLSLRTRILNFRTRAVENGWHAAVASVQSFRHAIRRSRTAASDFRRRIGRAFRKVVDSKGNLKDEEIRSYDRSFATSHER